MQYEKVLQALQVPRTAVDCSCGRIPVPWFGLEAPSFWYGFPPVLIPIWSEGSGPNYFAYWKHWFVERNASYVRMFIGANRLVQELGQTWEQLLVFMGATAIGISDGVTDDIRNFANLTGLSGIEDIDKMTLDTGDNPKGFVVLDQFKEEIPLMSSPIEEQYTGSFPVAGKDTSWLTACSFEMPAGFDFMREGTPPWFGPEKKGPLFERFLKGSDLKSAWLTLNSTGWTISDAKAALQDISKFSKDVTFDLLVKAWLDVADESAGGY